MNHQRHQLPLDLKRDSVDQESAFFTSTHNQAAVDWVNLWPKWNAPGLIIHGPKGCGKSHLGDLWQRQSNAYPLTLNDLEEDSLHILVQNHPHHLLTIDAFEASFEKPLFHLYNLIKESGGSLLILAKTPPRQWGIALADLRSRLCALPAVEISQPDDEAITLLLIKLFNDRQLTLAPATLTYILQRAPRSFEGIQKLVKVIDDLSLVLHREITIPLVRESLDHLTKDDPQA